MVVGVYFQNLKGLFEKSQSLMGDFFFLSFIICGSSGWTVCGCVDRTSALSLSLGLIVSIIFIIFSSRVLTGG